MDQNPWQRNNMTDMDYLNQISTKPPSRFSFGGLDPKFIIFIGAFLGIILILAIIVIVMNSKPTSSAPTTLAAKISSLETIVKYGEDNRDLFDSSITNVVSEIKITTDSDKILLTDLVKMPAKIDKTITAKENVTAITDELDSAKTTGRIGSDYIEALRAMVSGVINALEQNLKETKQANTKQSIQSIIDDFKELDSRLEALY